MMRRNPDHRFRPSWPQAWRSLPWRILLAVLILAALCIGVVSLSARRVHDALEEQTLQFQENDQWAVYQLQKEYLLTQLVAREALDGSAPALEGLPTQFEILASRLELLRHGLFAERVLATPHARAVAGALQDAVGRVDAAVAQGAAGPKLAAIILDVMTPLQVPVQELVMGHLTGTVARRVAQEQEIRDLLRLVELVFSGVLVVVLGLGGFAVIGLTRAEARRRALDTEQKVRALLEDSVEQRKLRALGALAAGIAHEINTPAQWISDNLTFMRRGLQDLSAGLQARPPEAAKREETEELLAELDAAGADALAGVERISRIVRAVRPFAADDDETPQGFVLEAGLRDALVLCRAAYRDIAAVDLVTAAPEVEVWGPRQSFIHVIAEIVGNAAQAIERRADAGAGIIRIEVAAPAAGGDAVIRISDNGVGILQEDMGRVFDPFFSTRRGYGVYGQGLAVCKASIENRFGGRIEMASEPGQGACVTITLPQADPAGRLTATSVAQSQPGRRLTAYAEPGSDDGYQQDEAGLRPGKAGQRG